MLYFYFSYFVFFKNKHLTIQYNSCFLNFHFGAALGIAWSVFFQFMLKVEHWLALLLYLLYYIYYIFSDWDSGRTIAITSLVLCPVKLKQVLTTVILAVQESQWQGWGGGITKIVKDNMCSLPSLKLCQSKTQIPALFIIWEDFILFY